MAKIISITNRNCANYAFLYGIAYGCLYRLWANDPCRESIREQLWTLRGLELSGMAQGCLSFIYTDKPPTDWVPPDPGDELGNRDKQTMPIVGLLRREK